VCPAAPPLDPPAPVDPPLLDPPAPPVLAPLAPVLELLVALPAVSPPPPLIVAPPVAVLPVAPDPPEPPAVAPAPPEAPDRSLESSLQAPADSANPNAQTRRKRDRAVMSKFLPVQGESGSTLEFGAMPARPRPRPRMPRN